MPATGTSPAGATSPTPAREPRPATSAGAGDRDAVPLAPGADRRWREIQAMFVDDPRGSLQQAADLIDSVIDEFFAVVRRRRAALAACWQDRDADTEALRITLKDYRAFWTAVRDMPAAAAAGGQAAADAGAAGARAGPGPVPGAGPGAGPSAGSHTAYGAGPGTASGASEPGRGSEPG